MQGSAMKGFLLSKHNLIRVGIILTILALIAQPVLAAGVNLKVFPPGSHPYGKTLNEWNAEWWKYVVSMPASNNPITDPTGENCGLGQSGPVFFLVGTTGGPAERDDCVVPAGKALLIPLINIFCAVPEDGATFADVKALCSDVTDHIDSAFLTVDGVSYPNMMGYRFPSPSFSFTGAIDNPFDTACGTPGTCYEGYHESGYGDGYYAMLTPLTPGAHTLHFGGHLLYPEWGWEFSVDITYNLTVAPGSVGR